MRFDSNHGTIYYTRYEAPRQQLWAKLLKQIFAANWQRKQNAANNWSATIPYDMELQRKETKEMLDDLTIRDQLMMFGLVTFVHMADSQQQLDSDTETLQSGEVQTFVPDLHAAVSAEGRPRHRTPLRFALH